MTRAERRRRLTGQIRIRAVDLHFYLEANAHRNSDFKLAAIHEWLAHEHQLGRISGRAEVRRKLREDQP